MEAVTQFRNMREVEQLKILIEIEERLGLQDTGMSDSSKGMSISTTDPPTLLSDIILLSVCERSQEFQPCSEVHFRENDCFIYYYSLLVCQCDSGEKRS